MMSRQITSRSFGAMETWEPPDKSFSKHTLQEGRGDLKPNPGAVCTLNLMLLGEPVELDEALLGGYKFGEDCEVTIGEGDTFFSGLLDTMVMNMKEGERCYFKSKFDLHGNKHSELEANSKAAALKFNIHLYSFSRTADLDELEQDERLECAQNHKDKGTELFKAGSLEFALKRYQKAVEYLVAMEPIGELPESLMKQHDTLKCQCYLNLAACRAKSEAHEDVIEHCTKALGVEENNVKGLFRRGQALCKIHRYAEAKTDLSKALELEPENKAVSNLLKTIDVSIQREKQMYKKMFS